jgi:pyrroline-5-carboxylate reductase
MGIAIASGVTASLESRGVHSRSASGASTPNSKLADLPPDAATPTRFIACVSRHETARKLKRTFADLGPLGQGIEVVAGENLKAVTDSDVVLLWCGEHTVCRSYRKLT